MYLYIKSLQRLPNGVKLYLLTQIVMGIGMGMWNLNLNYFLLNKGFSTSEIGVIIAIGPTTTALFSLCSGYFCDKYGYKSIMIIGCIIKTVAMFSIITVPQSFVYISRILNGIGDSMILTCTYPYITSMVKKEERSVVYSLLFSCSMFAMFLGNTIGGFLLNLWSNNDRYNNSILLSAIIVGSVVFMRKLLPNVSVNGHNTGKRLYIPRQKSIICYLLFDFLGYTGYFLSYSLLNLLCRDYIGLTEWKTGLATGGLTIMSSIAVFEVPPIANMFGRAKTSLTILIALIGLYVLMSFVQGYPFIVFAIITALLSNMIAGLLDGPMLNRIQEGEKGGFSGLRILITNAGTSLGTTIAGNLLGASIGITIIYIAVSVLLLLQTIVFIFGFKNLVEER